MGVGRSIVIGIHRLEEGMCIKPLPYVGVDGKMTLITTINYFMPNREALVIDNIGILDYIRKNELAIPKYTGSYHIIFSKHDEDYKFFKFGKTIKDLLFNKYPDVFKTMNNKHLKVVVDLLPHTSSSGITSHTNSHEVEMDWTPPVDLTSSDRNQKWMEFLSDKQKLSDLLDIYSPIKHREKIKEVYGVDIVGELISKERDKKIKQILND